MSFEEQERQRTEDGRARVASLMPLLRGFNALWHRTSGEGLRSIAKSGAIQPNNGDLPSKYFSGREKKGSYGELLRAVHLFDFDTPTLNDVFWAAEHWAGFLTDYEPNTIWFRISRMRLVGSAIIEQSAFEDRMPPLQTTSQGETYYPRWIPRVEAWYQDVIPTTTVEKVLIFQRSSSSYEYREFEDISQALASL